MLIWSIVLYESAAATLEVGTPGGYTTVQEAVAAAQSGDTIEIAAGVYDGPVRLGQVALELVGVDGSANTRIVPPIGPEPTAATVTVKGRAPVTLRGLSIDGGQQQRALFVRDADLFGEDLAVYGGVEGYGTDLAIHDSDVAFVGVALDVPITSHEGGKVEVLASRLDFDNVSISGGETENGIGGALYMYDTDATFRGCSFVGNAAAEGGALFIEAVPSNVITIEDTVFEGNHATSGPGGAVFQLEGQLRMVRTTVRDSSATEVGGGVVHLGGRRFDLEDSVVERAHGVLGGGVVLLDVAHVGVVRSWFVGNRSDSDGGGLLLLGATVDADVGGNTFCGNTASAGGGIHATGDPALVGALHHNLFVGNEASVEGAAIALHGGPFEVVQNTIVDSLTAGGRGALYAGSASLPHVKNNAFAFNTGTAGFTEPPAGIDGGYNLYYANDVNLATPAGAEPDGTWSDVTANPKFLGYVAADCGTDVRPGPGSPLVDGGDPTGKDDDGTRSDIGRYGGAGAAGLVDVDGDGVIVGDCAPFDPGALSPTDEVVADGIDQDCDGLDLCWVDADSDGFGVDETVTGPLGCDGPGTAPEDGDCDDTDPERAADCAAVEDTGDLEDDPPARGDDLQPAWFCSAVGSRSAPGVGVWIAAWLLFRRRRS